MEALGKKRLQNRVWVMKRAADIGLDTAHLDGRPTHETPVVPSGPHPFQGQEHFGAKGGRTGLTVACSWFLSRGYNVSIPLEPASYDLVAESDEGLKRIQVKTSSDTRKFGRHHVSLTHVVYDSTRTPNMHGAYRRIPYTAAEIDLFFVATNSGRNYLIPVAEVVGQKSIVLDIKYAAFAV